MAHRLGRTDEFDQFVQCFACLFDDPVVSEPADGGSHLGVAPLEREVVPVERVRERLRELASQRTCTRVVIEHLVQSDRQIRQGRLVEIGMLPACRSRISSTSSWNTSTLVQWPKLARREEVGPVVEAILSMSPRIVVSIAIEELSPIGTDVPRLPLGHLGWRGRRRPGPRRRPRDEGHGSRGRT